MNAVGRELQSPVVSDPLRNSRVIPFIIQCHEVDEKSEWESHLSSCCEILEERTCQADAFDYALALLNSSKPTNHQNSVAMINGLCSSAASIPALLVSELLQHPKILQFCLRSVLGAVHDFYPDKYFERVLAALFASPISRSAIVMAGIEMMGVPDQLRTLVLEIIRERSSEPEVLSVLLRLHFRAVSQRFITSKELQDLVLRVNVYLPEYHDTVAQYFEEQIHAFGDASGLEFFARIMQSKSPHVVRLVRFFVCAHQSTNAIRAGVIALTKPSALENVEEWTTTVQRIMPILPKEQANALTEFLIKFTSQEISQGHVHHTPATVEGIDEIPVHAGRDVYVRGHREINQLLLTLSCSTSDFMIQNAAVGLLKKALSTHTYPLLPGVVALLTRLTKDPTQVLAFMKLLSSGNSSFQLFSIQISRELLKNVKSAEIQTTMPNMILGYAANSTIESVKCAAIQMIPQVTKLGQEWIQKAGSVLKMIGRSHHPMIREALNQINSLQLDLQVLRPENDDGNRGRIPKLNRPKQQDMATAKAGRTSLLGKCVLLSQPHRRGSVATGRDVVKESLA
jgi:hypothetical protein